MSALEKMGINLNYKNRETGFSDTQSQTKNTFAFKWAKRETYESDHVKEKAYKWMLERYCGNDKNKLSEWLDNNDKIILDAGCGSGFSGLLFFNSYLKDNHYLGVDISDAVNIAKQRFTEAGYNGDFIQCSVNDIPIPDESIDIIFSEGVLHHTDSTQQSIIDLTKKLKRKGRFLFYVYKKKAVIREFTDDLIREAMNKMNDEDAWKAIEPLTKLGKALGELNIEFEVPEDIEYLGIKKGKQNLQRFFYWNIFKAYYDPQYSIDEMNHINFDWYRPSNCHRHTPEEIKEYCIKTGLTIDRLYVDEAGISVVARK